MLLLSILLPFFQSVIVYYSYIMLFIIVIADIIPIFWLQLASMAEWYADYTKRLFFPCSVYKFQFFSWWSLFNVWKMVSLFKDNTSVDRFRVSQWWKIFTGSYIIVTSILGYRLSNNLSYYLLSCRKFGQSRRSVHCCWKQFSPSFHTVRILILI